MEEEEEVVVVGYPTRITRAYVKKLCGVQPQSNHSSSTATNNHNNPEEPKTVGRKRRLRKLSLVRYDGGEEAGEAGAPAGGEEGVYVAVDNQKQTEGASTLEHSELTALTAGQKPQRQGKGRRGRKKKEATDVAYEEPMQVAAAPPKRGRPRLRQQQQITQTTVIEVADELGEEADTSFVPEEEQEEDLEEEEDCFVPTPKKRSKLGGASGRCPPTRTKPQKQQKKKRKSGTRIQTLSAAPINQLPDIFNDVMKALPASQQNYYDIYEVQNLVVASALDIATFGSPDAYQRLVEHVVQVVTNNEKYCKHGSGSGESVEKDAEVLRRYNEYMDSADQKKKRSYRNDPQSRHVWTPEEIERFKVAFKKYGYGPTSNRKIANYIGGNVHPNHVSYFKHQYKRMLKQQEKEKANNLHHHPT
ncbi:hypothetical protein QOT17_003090 [Balamuthia mandrillaris]